MSSTHDDITTFDLTTGCPVFTADGVQLGDIKEVRPDSFKLDTAWRPDYWLLRSTVETASDERVTLGLTEADVKRERMPRPVQGEGAPPASITDRDDGYLMGGGDLGDTGQTEDEAIRRVH